MQPATQHEGIGVSEGKYSPATVPMATSYCTGEKQIRGATHENCKTVKKGRTCDSSQEADPPRPDTKKINDTKAGKGGTREVKPHLNRGLSRHSIITKNCKTKNRGGGAHTSLICRGGKAGKHRDTNKKQVISRKKRYGARRGTHKKGSLWRQ